MTTPTNSASPARTILVVDCDLRTEAMLRKSLQRLGITTEALRQDQGAIPPGVIGVVVELDQFESPGLLAQADAADLPIIALSHHETLSQIQCAIRMGATAMLNKPITQSSVYTTLMMAQGLREKLSALQSDNTQLYDRVRARPLIAKAIVRLMLECGISEDEAFERVRTLSMTLNQSIEAICQDIEHHTPPLRQRN